MWPTAWCRIFANGLTRFMDRADELAPMPSSIRVQVAYAEPQRQIVVHVELPAGSVLSDAIAASNIAAEFPTLEIHPDRVGIFGQKASLQQTLADGDRVELYRPLLIEPKQARRLKAAAQQLAGEEPG